MSSEDSGSERDMYTHTDSSLQTPSEDSFVTNPYELDKRFGPQSTEAPPDIQAMHVYFRASRWSMDIQSDFTLNTNTPTQDPSVAYPYELHKRYDHQSVEVPSKFQALHVHFRASKSLPIPDSKTGYLWACAPNAIAQISVCSLLLTQEAYQMKSLSPSPSTAGSPGSPLASEQPALGATEGLESTPPSTAEAVLPRATTPPLSVHHPDLNTSGGSYARRSPYPACLVVDAARKYRLLGAGCLHILIRWLLVDYDNKPPARLFSEIAGQLASREVVEFKRDLRRTIHNIFLSVWDVNNNDWSKEQDRRVCFLLCSLYKAQFIGPGDVQEALQHLLKMPYTRPLPPAQHRPQAVRQRCLMGIHAIVTHGDGRLCQREPQAMVRIMEQIVTQLSKKIERTDNFLWYESRPQEVQRVIDIVNVWLSANPPPKASRSFRKSFAPRHVHSR